MEKVNEETKEWQEQRNMEQKGLNDLHIKVDDYKAKVQFNHFLKIMINKTLIFYYGSCLHKRWLWLNQN